MHLLSNLFHWCKSQGITLSCRIHSWCPEHFSGHAVQEDSCSDRVVPESFSSSVNCSLSSRNLRSICSPLQSTRKPQSFAVGGQILMLIIQMPCLCVRSQLLAYAFPPIALLHRVLLKAREDQIPYMLTHSSSLARSSLVSTSTQVVDRGSSPTPPDSRPVDTGQGLSQACKPGRLVPGCMAHKRQALVAQGLSEQVARTILAARATSTYKLYESGWKHYTRWRKK